MDENTLSGALDRAELIFRDAGIRLIWLGCQPGSPRMVACPESGSDGAGTLIVRIIPRAVTGFVSRSALGVAFPTQRDTVYATVFRDRLLAIAFDGRYSEAVLLGLTIAHELGHLLLGTPTHSRYGVMAGRWRDYDLDRAAVGMLLFSRGEAAQMRAQALHRGNTT